MTEQDLIEKYAESTQAVRELVEGLEEIKDSQLLLGSTELHDKMRNLVCALIAKHGETTSET